MPHHYPSRSAEIDKPTPYFVRFLVRMAAFVVGAIFGGTAAVLIAEAVSGGNDLLMGFLLMPLFPLGSLATGAVTIRFGVRLYDDLVQADSDEHLRRVERQRARLLAMKLTCVFGAMIWGIQYLASPPSDRALIANFDRHESEFNQLVTMFHEDRGLRRIGDNWTDPEESAKIHVSPARIALYRKRLKEVGTPSGLTTYGYPNLIAFYYWGRGSAVSSDHFKGYAYLAQPPKEVVDDLDNQPIHSRFTFRHLRGNWYLY